MDDEVHDIEERLTESQEESRPPTVEDLLNLCRELNLRGAKYLIVGGFAIRGAGYLRETYDLDLIIDTDLENEAKVYKSLELLADKAVLELAPGEVSKYTVVRVADEITVDLMQSASGIDYEEASKEIVLRRVQDVDIPFASPRLLWRMKKNTHREKDIPDLIFLRQHYPEVVDT
ncbi:MAG: hypothetical protein RL015_2462 [Verrucomicrobiota bacterium]|jgi:hypothetical protein